MNNFFNVMEYSNNLESISMCANCHFTKNKLIIKSIKLCILWCLYVHRTRVPTSRNRKKYENISKRFVFDHAYYLV